MNAKNICSNAMLPLCVTGVGPGHKERFAEQSRQTCLLLVFSVMYLTTKCPSWACTCFPLIKYFSSKHLHAHLAAHLCTCSEGDKKGVQGNALSWLSP